MSDQSFENVVLRRLEELEARNRRLARALVGVTVFLVVLAAVNGVLTWAVWARGTVEADEFVVRDPDGRPRARLAYRDSGTGIQSTTLTFFDADGKVRVRLAAGDPCYLELSSGEEDGYVSLSAGKKQCDLAMYFQKRPAPSQMFLNLHRDWARVSLDAGRGQSWKQEVGDGGARE
jgi:hypothetical protein